LTVYRLLVTVKDMIKLKNIQSYKTASELTKIVWNRVNKWSFLAQKTIGSQWIRSVDSIAANIAEGEGRYFKKDKIKFFYQARGSAYESAHWADRAKERDLISDGEYKTIMFMLKRLPKEINSLISGASKNLKR